MGMMEDQTMQVYAIAFPSKIISSDEQCYSNIEWKTPGILHSLEMFLHYCFAKEVYVITDDKPLVAIFSRNEAMLSLHLCYRMFELCNFKSQHKFKLCCCTTDRGPGSLNQFLLDII